MARPLPRPAARPYCPARTNGTTAYTPAPARDHAEVTRQLLGTGLDVVGTSRMPEYGLNASTEFADAEPTRTRGTRASPPGRPPAGRPLHGSAVRLRYMAPLSGPVV